MVSPRWSVSMCDGWIDFPSFWNLGREMIRHIRRACNPPSLLACAGYRDGYGHVISVLCPLSGTVLRTLPRHHEEMISAIAWGGGSSARFLASASTDGSVCVYAPSRGECLFVLEHVPHRTTALAFSNRPGRIRRSKRKSESVEAKREGNKDAEWSDVKSTELLCTGDSSGALSLWACDTGFRCRAAVQAHDRSIWSFAFVLGGRILISNSSDGSVRFWDCTDAMDVAGKDLNQPASIPLLTEVSNTGSGSAMSSCILSVSIPRHILSALIENSVSGGVSSIFLEQESSSSFAPLSSSPELPIFIAIARGNTCVIDVYEVFCFLSF